MAGSGRDLPRGAPGFASMLAGVLGGLVVAVLVVIVRPLPDESAVGSSAQLDQMERGLKALVQSVDSLQGSMDRIRFANEFQATKDSGSVPSHLAQPDALTTVDLTPITEAIDRLVRAIQQGAQPPDPRNYDPVRKEPLRHFLLAGTGIPREDWRFWPVGLLLDKYGAPDVVERDNQGWLRWTYRWDDGAQVTFKISEGVAIDQALTLPPKK